MKDFDVELGVAQTIGLNIKTKYVLTFSDVAVEPTITHIRAIYSWHHYVAVYAVFGADWSFDALNKAPN